jgi:hypothetical protein
LNKHCQIILLSFQIMKQKNTGIHESNQGHRAKLVPNFFLCRFGYIS